ncbi:MAG: NAD-dependent glycerol-3-phosphate dehydrogenase C-terminus, partial [Thermoleophilaceae bacterium]|nr:NAD-dependent glycerol-3-phosphate dehydrogenase C-terminus [Thermoleophilaceae bacterium]
VRVDVAQVGLVQARELLVDVLSRAGIDAPATTALGALIEGRIDSGAWLAEVRSQSRAA